MKDLPFRQVHLDFHTSEHIPDVGADFDPDRYVATLRDAHVNSITMFARGHHGWCYYPTKVGKPHPNLKRPDLLGDMITACRKADIGVVAYNTVQWDELSAREHPEWRVVHARNQAVWPIPTDQSAMNQLTPTWHTLCLSNDAVIDQAIALNDEIIDRYHPDGLFMDILISWECVCRNCIAGMRKKGMDPENPEDRLEHHRSLVLNYYKRVTEAAHKKDPDVRIFHNSGHIYKGDRERYAHFTHLELESLPTGGWGYDHFPTSARYVNTLGMQYLGMSGKFHTMWGEFGGYKRPAALEYECASMVANGARCSIGDQLHPSGAMDPDTYASIAPAFARVEALEPYLIGAQPVSDIAILSAEACNREQPGASMDKSNAPDDGVSRMLLELHQMFDLIDADADFSRYRLIVCPDSITMEGDLLRKVQSYIKGGGRLILSGASGMKHNRNSFALELPLTFNGGQSELFPDFIESAKGLDADLVASPFVVYERAYRVKNAGGEILAGTRVPYFNRTWEHFCSHQHTPYRTEGNPMYDAAIRAENVIYFSHPIFTAYFKSGQPLLKYLFRGALNLLLPEKRVEVRMPSAGRMTLMEQKAEKRLLLHLLFAQTQLRGSGLQYPDGRTLQVEIIEDTVPISNVACKVRVAERPKRVYSAYSGADLQFQYESGTVTVTVPEVNIHEVVVIE